MNKLQDPNNNVCPICGYKQDSPYRPSYITPGTMLNDNYLIGKLLKHDGEGATYIAYDIIANEKVTIREYMPDAFCSREKDNPIINVNPKYIAQFKTYMSEFVELNRKLSKMRTINHIISAKDLFGNNNTGYVVYNYFDGITMSEYISQNGGTLTWEHIKELIAPIFTILSLLHNAGIVHRGISPENILINEDKEVKLSGFAISDIRTANTELASELYSGYAAPEQYSSSGWQGTWTDVYGISAFLYKVLTGDTPADAISRVNNDNLISPVAVNPNIPATVSSAIMKGLSVNGNIRVQTITELATALFDNEESRKRPSNEATQVLPLPVQVIAKQREEQINREKENEENKSKGSIFGMRWIFVVALIITLGLGMFFLLMILIQSTEKDDQLPAFTTVITETKAPPQAMTEPLVSEETTKTEYTQPEMIYVMNKLVGKNYEMIERSSNYDNLVFVPKYEYNDGVAMGNIVSQSIAEGESYYDGTEINVVVSLGASKVPVPEFLALTSKEYFSKLNALDIKYEEVKMDTNEVMEGYIVDVSTPAGELINVEVGEVLLVYVAVNDENFLKDKAESGKDIIIEDEIIISVYD